MAMNLCPALYLKVEDKNGRPLAGGLVYTYIAGSLDPAPTYSDATGVDSNPNPVVLNSAGIADIWIDPALAYKFVITAADGTPFKTIDNVTSPNAASAGLTKVSAGDATLGYLSSKIEGGTNISVTTDTDPVTGAEKIVISCSDFALNDLQGAYDDGDGTISLAEDKPVEIKTNATSSATDSAFKVSNGADVERYSIQEKSVRHSVVDSYYYRDLGVDPTETRETLSRGGRYRYNDDNTVDPNTTVIERSLSDSEARFSLFKTGATSEILTKAIFTTGSSSTSLLLETNPETDDTHYRLNIGNKEITLREEIADGIAGKPYTYRIFNEDQWDFSVKNLPNSTEMTEFINGTSTAYTKEVRFGSNTRFSHSFNSLHSYQNIVIGSNYRQLDYHYANRSQNTIALNTDSFAEMLVEDTGFVNSTFKVQSVAPSNRAELYATRNLSSGCLVESRFVQAKIEASDLANVGSFKVFNNSTLVDDVWIRNDEISYLKTGLRTKAHIYSERVVHGWSSTIFLQWEEGNFHEITLAGTTSFSLVNGPNQYGASYGVLINNPGAHTVGWGGNVLWAGGVEPDLAVAGVHMVTFYHTVIGGTDVYLALAATSFA